MVGQLVDNLDDIQGNILAGFNKNHTTFIFATITEAAMVRRWIGEHHNEIATVAEVSTFNEAYRAVAHHRGKHLASQLRPIESMWVNIAFSAVGLRKLADGTSLDLAAFDAAFAEGLRARAASLGHAQASDPKHWDQAFVGDAVDLVLIVAADAEARRTAAVGHYEHELRVNGLEILTSWRGEARADELGHEHFGFKDGISQPGIDGFTANPSPGTDLIQPGEFVLGYRNQSGADNTPTTMRPTPDQTAYSPSTPAPVPVKWMINGSYLVLQKLQQDVPAFNAGVQAIAAQLELDPERTGGKLVGRYKTGCPLETVAGVDCAHGDPSGTHVEVLDDANINAFEYDPDDGDGHIVPTAAHIRKAYPRNQANPGEAEAQKHRILRRGIAYGPSLPHQADSPYGAGTTPDRHRRGLLFACYQALIENQFEFIQRNWVNDPGFPHPDSGVDPILNEVDGRSMTNIPDQGQAAQQVGLKPWVTMKGGGYFFAPGLAGLRALAGIE